MLPIISEGCRARYLISALPCGLVYESFGPAFALQDDAWTARADNIPVAHCLPTLSGPLAHRVHKGYNNQIIFDTKKYTRQKIYRIYR
uniref:Uncharacterized protein n=1 Tax=Candidatus Kentrum sp. UNK TaxID=2126344 RepID=A0A451AKC4_9GAMM|nr:MAG: hypothetical protein BECKUNK1418G_GA0071005_10958 [Candidatus Kentron sp. UNK]VFK71686.1 MAG: hypothetical protein BECKUNK1418H_GA0071006_107811 [Candidatus Kentron sp. UNK]